jgi:uncharacterized protein YggT (Ycf19 family)
LLFWVKSLIFPPEADHFPFNTLPETNAPMHNWLFEIPNLALAALMYTLLGRFLLSLFFQPGSDKVIWRVFVQITNPAVNAVRFITPQLVPANLAVLFAAIWALMLRVALYLAIAGTGPHPGAGV